jgi:hypothetical protein
MTDMPDWWGYEMPWTKEEEDYLKLYWEVRDTWSEVACTLLEKAEGAAMREFMIHYFVGEPEEPRHYDEITDEMRLACAKLTGRDLELFKKLARAALLVAASIDPDGDDRRGPEYLGYEPNPHHYYRLLSGLLWAIVTEWRAERERQTAALMKEREGRKHKGGGKRP